MTARGSVTPMGYRDESEALRARIRVLEQALNSKPRRLEAPQVSKLSATSPLEKKTTRYSLTLNGRLSKDGLDSIRQMLWTRVGDAETNTDSAEGNPPGETRLRYARGAQVFRVVESGGRTYLSVDDRRWGAGQTWSIILALAGAMALSMLAAGVHEDWIQMAMGCYAMATILLGPLVTIGSQGVGKSRSVALLQEAAGIAQDHMRIGRMAARVETSEEAAPVAEYVDQPPQSPREAER
ncbi:MAG: hypothetical protein AB8H86_01475 [Polyangiales bacterium]